MRMLLVHVLLLCCILRSSSQVIKPSTPEICNSDNQGKCVCRSSSHPVQTFVFWPTTEYQRCIYMHIPESDDPLPVLIHLNGYGDGFLSPDPVNSGKYYGYAVIGLGSTGPKDGAGGFGLEFPNNGIVNPSNPTPCSPEDSREYEYINGVLNLISDLDELDESKVYLEGFSQSSMFSAYAAVCFADRVTGVFQGGSGLAKTYHTPITPGLQGQCSLSDFLDEDSSCCENNFCENCTWWPIYPKTCENHLIDCLATYTNDAIACGSDFYMYEAMIAEGNDARMLSFSGGGHKNPENRFAWMVGCLGIVDSCSVECETTFLDCITSNSPTEFERCETELKTGALVGCDTGCAPTLEMLKTSETPVINLSEGKFGTQTGLEKASNKPTQPDCKTSFGVFDDKDGRNKCFPPSGVGPAGGDIGECGGGEPCIPLGSSCFLKNKKEGGCDDTVCESKVCGKRASCCASKYSQKCADKAVELCSNTCACEEPSSNEFYFKTKKKKGKTVIVTKSCDWLGDQKPKKIANLCRKKIYVDGYQPARVECPKTCNVCT